jgi:hypothetical protein
LVVPEEGFRIRTPVPLSELPGWHKHPVLFDSLVRGPLAQR